MPYSEIAFLNKHNGERFTRIYRLDVTKSIEIMVGTIHDANQIGWSADSRYLMIHATQRYGEFSDIYIMDTEQANRLTNLTNSAVGEFNPQWSPVLTQIAYEPQISVDSSLNLLDIGQKRDMPILPAEVHINGDLSWSPDGDQIAVAVPGAIILVGMDSEREWILNPYDGVIEHVAWSPDGQSLIFSSNQTERWELYRVDLNTPDEAQQLTHRAWELSLEHIRWSPEGHEVLFLGHSDDWKIYRLDLATGNVIQLATDTTQQVSNTGDSLPYWSEDGQRITFISNREDGIDHLYLMDHAGDSRRLSNLEIQHYAWRR